VLFWSSHEYRAGKIRNLVLVGHGSTGKTTLVESLLHKAGATPRMGTVEQGNTVCDFDDLEKERKALDRLGRRLVRL